MTDRIRPGAAPPALALLGPEQPGERRPAEEREAADPEHLATSHPRTGRRPPPHDPQHVHLVPE